MEVNRILLICVIFQVLVSLSQGLRHIPSVFSRRNVLKTTQRVASGPDSKPENAIDDKVMQMLQEKLGSELAKSGRPTLEPDVDEYIDEPFVSEEKIFRVFPKNATGLPLLSDRDNYYSGQFHDQFWHQNADTVLVHIPIAPSVSKRDIAVKFRTTAVEMSVNGETISSFNCSHGIIPSGSAWSIETSSDDSRYVQLEMEKRLRIINWHNLFAHVDPSAPNALNKKDLIARLLEANQGLGRVTGKEPETLEQLLQHRELVDSLRSEAPDMQPTIVSAQTVSGERVSGEDLGAYEEVAELQRRIEAGEMPGVTALKKKGEKEVEVEEEDNHHEGCGCSDHMSS